MEAIRKKVQAMKVEKDNLCDKCDEVEQVSPGDRSLFLRLPFCLFFAENEGVSAPP